MSRNFWCEYHCCSILGRRCLLWSANNMLHLAAFLSMVTTWDKQAGGRGSVTMLLVCSSLWFGMLLPWPHGQAVMLPPLCGSAKRSDQVWCSRFRDRLDFLYSKSKVNALHVGHFFIRLAIYMTVQGKYSSPKIRPMQTSTSFSRK